MSTYFRSLENTVDTALAGLNLRVSPPGLRDSTQNAVPYIKKRGPGTWRLTPASVEGCEIDARLGGEWLELTAPLPAREGYTHSLPSTAVSTGAWPTDAVREGAASTGEEAWHWLRLSGRLAGTARIARVPLEGSFILRADVSLGFEPERIARCRAAVADITTAWAKIAGLETSRILKPSPRTNGRGPLPELRELCAEAGWKVSDPAGDRLMVDLNVPGAFHQASVVARTKRQCRASVEVTQFEDVSDVSRQALAILLLTANNMVRLARAGVGTDGKRTRAWFEVRFSRPSSPENLDEALNALSAACRMCTTEARALADDRRARMYTHVVSPGRPFAAAEGIAHTL